MKLRLQAMLVLGLFFCSPALWADVDPMSQMKDFMASVSKQMATMQKTIEQQGKVINQQNEKIEQLQRYQPQVQMGAPSSDGTAQMTQSDFDNKLKDSIGDASKWLKDLKFAGDYRLRYESFQNESGNPSETDPRNRFRMRLRYGFEKTLPSDFKVGFSMATGEVAGTGNDSGLQVDPTSTNQSFDNLFNFKDIWIEKAYATYTPAWALVLPIINKLTLSAGKVANPFEKGSSDMVWDRDVKPEGAFEQIDFNIFDSPSVSVKAYGLAGQFILDEDSSSAPHMDSKLFAYQAGFDIVGDVGLEQPVGWSTAFSYYTYPDFAENGNFLIGATSLARGNSNMDANALELDADDFKVFEIYNELKLHIGEVPVNPFFDVAHNAGSNVTTQDDETWAYSLGTKIGGIKKKGDWEVSYAYKRIENNSVAAIFTDSDFGLGHAGKAGSQFKLGYGLTDNLTLNGAAWFVDNLTSGTGGVRDERQNRFQADLVWKF